jgi:hypothetical protein
MNFIEFLKEDVSKELFTIINVADGTVPERNGEVYQTWAVSPAKAKWQIIHRLKQEPDKYSWKVINNPDDYKAITWEQYKQINAPKPLTSEVPPVKMKEDPQLKLFDDPIQRPY